VRKFNHFSNQNLQIVTPFPKTPMVATMGSNTYFRVGTGEYNHICEKRLGKHVPQQLYTLWKIESIQEMDYILKNISTRT
jgi:hypothetical protein